MAQKSGFFNARLIGGEYDRRYNANDYCDNLAVIISNGVLRSENDDLKPTATGMNVTIAAGRAWINGHYYLNDSPVIMSIDTAPASGSRYDRIMLRLDNSAAERSVKLVYVKGVAGNTPAKPEPTRNNTIFELVIADIFINANAQNVVLTDQRANPDLCGWIFSTSGDGSFFESLDASFNEWFAGVRDTLSSVTLFKRYTWRQTLSSATTTVVFDIPQFDVETCFIEVYVNGILDTRYTVNNNIITFAGTLTAGTVVTVNCYKSIDGTGIMTVADEITELQNQFATLSGISKFTYKCTGLNDNIALSEIAQALIDGSYTVGTLSAAAEAFLNAIGGNTYINTIPADAHITIAVSGVLGATTPYSGTGTADNRYKWFYFGATAVNQKRIIFDFAKVDKVDVECSANTKNIIFFGNDLWIKNANVFAHSTDAGCEITIALGASAWGNMDFEQCFFRIITTGKAMIAQHGNFNDCYCGVKSTNDNAFCFDVKEEALVRMNGGTFFAYIGNSSKIASIINIESTQTNAVAMAVNINCPTVAQSGYIQQYLARTNAGMALINGVVSTMTCTGNAANRNVIAQIWKTKH